MGNYSWLFATRNNAKGCRIDWASMNTEKLFRSALLEETYSDSERPDTLEDMAQIFHDTKFCNYLDEDYIVALGEFTRHLIPYGSFPRLYFEYEGYSAAYCFEFYPGTSTIMMTTLKFSQLLRDLPPHPEKVKENYTVDEEEAWELLHEAKKQDILKTLPECEGWKYWPPLAST